MPGGDAVGDVEPTELTFVESNLSRRVARGRRGSTRTARCGRRPSGRRCPDDLARTQVERHVVDGADVPGAAEAQVPDGEHAIARGRRGGVRSTPTRPSRPVMRSNNPRDVDIAAGACAHHAAVAQHRHAIGDRQQFLETMRDVDDRPHRATRDRGSLEESRDLGGRERRRRLVHHQHARVVDERAGNLDDLLLPERQRADETMRATTIDRGAARHVRGRRSSAPRGQSCPSRVSARARRTGSPRSTDRGTAAVPGE